MTKLKYEIKEIDNEKKVYFTEYDDNVGWCINTDEKGHEYVHIPNVYLKDKGIFYNMDGHAVKAVFEGYAHALQGADLIFGDRPLALHPIIFLDAKYGEKMRKKTMEGWKNTTWKYGIVFGNKNSLLSGNLINDTKDGDMILGFEEKMKPLLFSTREEAEEAIRELEWEAEMFIQNRMIKNTNDDEQFYKKLVDDVRGVKNEIIRHIMHWAKVEYEGNNVIIECNYYFDVKEVIDQKGGK